MFKLPSPRKWIALAHFPSQLARFGDIQETETPFTAVNHYTRATFLIHGAKRGCWQEEEEKTEQCDSDVQGRLAAEGCGLIKTALYSKGLCIFLLSIMAKSELNNLHKSEKID